MSFLGIELDSVSFQARLSQEKLEKCRANKTSTIEKENYAQGATTNYRIYQIRMSISSPRSGIYEAIDKLVHRA